MYSKENNKRVSSFFREHLMGMVIFAISTGLAVSYLHDKFNLHDFNSSEAKLVRFESIRNPASWTETADIVHTMVDLRELDRTCVKKLADPTQTVEVATVDLNKDGKDEYIVCGTMPCAYGARMPMYWVFAKSGNGYRMLLSSGALDNLYISNQSSNGYCNLVSKIVTGAGSETFYITFKYDGHQYREYRDTK
jgi:hypothetical protein